MKPDELKVVVFCGHCQGEVNHRIVACVGFADSHCSVQLQCAGCEDVMVLNFEREKMPCYVATSISCNG